MALNGKWLMCNLKKTVLVADAGAVFYWAFGGAVRCGMMYA